MYYSSDVSEALKRMLRCPSWTVSGSAGAVLTSAGERGVAIDALNTPGSCRVVAVDQCSCTSVWRAMSLEFGNIWQSRVTWNEDACVLR